MKLYEDDVAPNCRRVRIFLTEKGIDIPGEKLSVAGGDNLSEAYQAKNPHGVLPLLELDDGTRIGESVAICRYFEELHPEPNLLGSTALEKAAVDM